MSSVARFILVVATAIATYSSVVSSVAASPVDLAVACVDDFQPQPLQGETVWFFNRLGGDRGEINDEPGKRTVEWGQNEVTARIAAGQNTWVGVWTSLNHPISEGIPLNFASIFPSQILPQFQGRVVGVRVHLLGGMQDAVFQVELQAPDLSFPWRDNAKLDGGAQILEFVIPELMDIQSLNWLLIGNAGDFVTVDKVELVLEVPTLDTPERAFLWSYAMLLSNFDPGSGLTRDRARFPSGRFDNVSASGAQAAAAVLAWHLGFISQASAIAIVEQTSAGLLALPHCNGLWPHFVENGQIVPGTEWSSIDTVIACVLLIQAHEALGLDATAVEQVLLGIDWAALILPNGTISHGYDFNCQLLPNGWHDFGTETWLVNFGFAAATGSIAEMDVTPPTFNGSGFIDELAWLFLLPPRKDGLGICWSEYRQQAADAQLDYYRDHPCYGGPCRLFGLSAAEVPKPHLVHPDDIYQAFGVGGEVPPNDGSDLLGSEVIVPHYAGMISSLRPDEAICLWNEMEQREIFTPLNNVESFLITEDSNCQDICWNSLKGSWNLSLQTLGWGRLLAGNDNPLYQAMCSNDILYQAYTTLVPCILEMDASYEDGILTLDFKVATPEPTTWAAWAFFQGAFIPLWSVPISAVEPPEFVSVSFPVPPLGTIGFVSCLCTADEATCWDFVFVDTLAISGIPRL